MTDHWGRRTNANVLAKHRRGGGALWGGTKNAEKGKAMGDLKIPKRLGKRKSKFVKGKTGWNGSQPSSPDKKKNICSDSKGGPVQNRRIHSGTHTQTGGKNNSEKLHEENPFTKHGSKKGNK